MRESQLRSYIRKEILRESGVYTTVADLEAIWSSVVDAFELVKVAFKDVLSSTAYVFDVFTAEDLEAIEKAKDNFQARKERIADEYAQAFSKVTENMGADFRAACFLMAPQYYLGSKVLLQGPIYYKDTVEYLRDAGLEVKTEPQRYAYSSTDYGKMLARAQEDSLMGRTTKHGSNADFASLSKSIMKRLNTKTGISTTPTESINHDLPIIVEKADGDKKKSSFAELAFEDLSKQLEGLDSDVFVDSAGVKKYLDLKTKEAEDYAGMINRPLQFVAEAAKAQDIAQLREAVKKMKGGAIKIDGLGPEEEKKIEAAAAELVKKAKENGNTEELFKAAGMKAPQAEKEIISEAEPTDAQSVKGQTPQSGNAKTGSPNPADEQLKQAAYKVAVMNAIKNFAMTFQNPAKAGESGAKYLAQLESVKKKFIESYKSDISNEDMEILKKTENGKKLIETMNKGVKMIESAGLLGAQPAK